ncbi:MAG: BlaI/MecI/CopY family transcriptional regulator [Syntrophomonadaceae bacterium]|nr:BlaI/MecI/CopY family transcriptional regulator [Syntrophomonadaceae bacterium]
MKFRLPVVFQPGKQGLCKVLGALESEIMEIIWSKSSEVCVRDVYEVLASRREIAYTTVMTIMGRLSDKNLLQKRKEGNTFYFKPAVSREEFTEKVVGSVLDALLDDFAAATMAHLTSRVTARDLETIAKLEKLVVAVKDGENNVSR